MSKEIEINIKIKLSSKKKLEIIISKQKALAKIIQAISNILPLFRPNIEIDKSSDNYYILTGKDGLGKFAVLYTIIEEIADLYVDLGNSPDFNK
ncbi:hypothetical protein ES708_06308 [subsurface metagenome]